MLLKEFFDEKGAFYFPKTKEILPKIKGLVEVARENRVPIVYVVDEHRKGKYDREIEFLGKKHCLEGDFGSEVVEEVRPLSEDYVVKKRRYSGFFATDLDLILRELKVDTLLVVGVKTNVCVRATVHDAFYLGYNVLVVRECVASNDSYLHEASLRDIERYYGRVIGFKEALKLLKGEIHLG